MAGVFVWIGIPIMVLYSVMIVSFGVTMKLHPVNMWKALKVIYQLQIMPLKRAIFLKDGTITPN